MVSAAHWTDCRSVAVVHVHGWLCRAISSRRLVPGDVLVLLRGKATCDMVLLSGNCLVEESMLSGEVPVLEHATKYIEHVTDTAVMRCLVCA